VADKNGPHLSVFADFDASDNCVSQKLGRAVLHEMHRLATGNKTSDGPCIQGAAETKNLSRSFVVLPAF
jgi:hypothetical protein